MPTSRQLGLLPSGLNVVRFARLALLGGIVGLCHSLGLWGSGNSRDGIFLIGRNRHMGMEGTAPAGEIPGASELE